MVNTPVMGTFEWGRRVKAKPLPGYEDVIGPARSTDMFEGNPDLIPPPTKAQRWGGICRYLPTRWAEDMKAQFAMIDTATPYCLSCHKNLLRAVPVLPHNPREKRVFYVQPPCTTGIRALAMASDHDRTYLNHQIVIVDGGGQELGRNPYAVLGMSWG
jgi:hypothetical protein